MRRVILLLILVYMFDRESYAGSVPINSKFEVLPVCFGWGGDPEKFALVKEGIDISIGVCRCEIRDGVFSNERCRSQCPLEMNGEPVDFKIGETRKIRYYNPITTEGTFLYKSDQLEKIQIDRDAFCYELVEAPYKRVSNFSPIPTVFFDNQRYCVGKVFPNPSKTVMTEPIGWSMFDRVWDYGKYGYPIIEEKGKVVEKDVFFSKVSGLDERIANTYIFKPVIYTQLGIGSNKDVGSGAYREKVVNDGWVVLGKGEKYFCHSPPRIDWKGISTVDTIEDRIPPIIDYKIPDKPDLWGKHIILLDMKDVNEVSRVKIAALYDGANDRVSNIYSLERGNLVYRNGVEIPGALKYYGITQSITSLKALGIGEDERDRVVVFVYGGVDVISNEIKNDLYILWFSDDLESLNVYRYEAEGLPRAKEAVLAYNKESNVLYILDGFGELEVFKKEAYALDFENNLVIKRSVENAINPGTSWLDIEWLKGVGFVYDERRDILYGFGGGSDRGVLDGIIKIHLSSMLATYESSGMIGGPGARGGMGIYYDRENNRVYMIGGFSGTSVENLVYHNDVWEYDLDTGRWRNIAVESESIPKVANGVLSLSSDRSGLIYYGGMCRNCDEDRKMVWRYDLTRSKWYKLRFISPVVLENNNPVSGIYNIEYPPKIEVSIPVDASSKIKPKVVMVRNNSNTLGFSVYDKGTNKRLVSGIRSSPELYGLLSGIRGNEYRIEIEPNEGYEENIESDYEVEIRDAEISSSPEYVYRYGGIRGIDSDGRYIYAVGSRGLEVIEIKGEKAELKSRNPLFGLATDIEVVNGIGYIANGPFGVSIVDLSNPEEIKVISNELLIGISWGIKVIGDRAYVSSGVFGVQVVDVSDKLNPIWEGTIWLKGVIGREIEGVGNYLFLRNLINEEVVRIDLSVRPEVIERSEGIRGGVEDIRIVGDELHILSKKDGVIVYGLDEYREMERYEDGMGLVFGEYVGKRFVKKLDKRGIGVYGVK